jgi:tetraacyldisaccharide 4'-kinase
VIRWRTPSWWYRRGRAPLLARALTPLSHLWADRTAARLRRLTPQAVGAPVVCVGNLTAGGSGKTPTAMEIARLLETAGAHPVVLASGYGGRMNGPVVVENAHHTADDVGDEALLMRRVGPVVVSRDRVAGARLAVAAGADVVVMDDGHQNPALVKAMSIVVVDGETRDGEWPFGDGSVIPVGPLREPLATGLTRADAVVVLLPRDVATADTDLLALFAGKTVWIARWTAGAPPAGRRLGFAGIAKPWRVERALRGAGCDLVAFEGFPDHAPIEEAALRRLARRAKNAGATLLTTEKDWVRLSPEWRARVAPWPARVVFDDEATVSAALLSACRDQAPARSA